MSHLPVCEHLNSYCEKYVLVFQSIISSSTPLSLLFYLYYLPSFQNSMNILGPPKLLNFLTKRLKYPCLQVLLQEIKLQQTEQMLTIPSASRLVIILFNQGLCSLVEIAISRCLALSLSANSASIFLRLPSCSIFCFNC